MSLLKRELDVFKSSDRVQEMIMGFKTAKAFVLRGEKGELGFDIPQDIKELLKQRGLTVVFVEGEVSCSGEFVGKNDTMVVQLYQSQVNI